GKTIEVVRGGKLVDTVVLPGDAHLDAIGGPGREFWVGGRNFPNQPRGGNPAESELGAWRVEVSSPADVFLNAMQIMDRDTAPYPVQAVEGPAVTGVRIGDRVVLFRRDSRRGESDVSFTLRGAGSLRILATDLAAGTWQVSRDGTVRNGAIQVAAEEGTA